MLALLGVLAACGTAAPPPAPAVAAGPLAASAPTATLVPAPTATLVPAPTATLVPAPTATLAPAATPLAPTSEPASDGTVEVSGGEFMFESTLTTFSVGTPYRFVVTNTGVVPHEWLVEKVEAGADDHAHTDHSDLIGEISVDELGPGMTATREVVFSSPGEYEFACRVPGHYEAGMKQTITVID
jgi:uncharacterized cupredoxin-like copper-binding protein